MSKIKRKFDINRYDDYVEMFIKSSEDINRVISFAKLQSYNLPDGRWFVNNCPDKTVNSWGQFVAWCGFYCKDSLTKEQVINLVFRKAERLNRPLMYDDFRGSGCYDIPFSCIKKYFGTMNQMKEELGLEIIQLKMEKLTKEDFVHDVEYIKSYVNASNKDFITKEEIYSLDKIHGYSCLNMFAMNNYNMSLSNYLFFNGVKTGVAGLGIKYSFEDGEETTSQFEYLLSNYLRNAGLEFEKDYFRDVKYSDIDSSYFGMMNCDYKICVNNKTIYIELAGLIRDYKEWYYANKKITKSNTKEKYRIKLKEKETMLKNNNLIYFILFPCDLINDFLYDILHNPSDELRCKIEKHNKHNIDWSLVERAS